MNDDEQIREVYAQFGLAIFLAQVLEHALVNAMVAGRLVERERFTKRDVDAFTVEQFEKPLGRLISTLSKYVQVPDELADSLRVALKERNWLAHHYFRERASAFMTEVGRQSMLEELASSHQKLEHAEAALTVLVKPIRERYGVTDAKLAEHERRLLVAAMNIAGLLR